MDTKKAVGIGIATALGMSVASNQLIENSALNNDPAQVAVEEFEPATIEVAEYQPATPIDETSDFVPPSVITDDSETTYRKVELTTEPIQLPTEETVEEPPKKFVDKVKATFTRAKETIKKTFSRKKKSTATASSVPKKKATPKRRKENYDKKAVDAAPPRLKVKSDGSPWRPTTWKQLNRMKDNRNIIPEGFRADFSRYRG